MNWPAKSEAKSLRVAIIEDNLAIAKMIGAALKRSGHTIVGYARSVEQSLELIKSSDFDIAILDIDLKDQHSGPTATALRHRNIPFIVMAGSAALLTASHAGAPLVIKPFKIDDLLQVVEQNLPQQTPHEEQEPVQEMFVHEGQQWRELEVPCCNKALVCGSSRAPIGTDRSDCTPSGETIHQIQESRRGS